MKGKRISIGNRPVADPGVETWVRQGDGASQVTRITQADVYTARLTIDVTPALRGRIKIAAFRQGITVADAVRALLEREFPDNEGGA
jgi:hypothetical protein